MLEEEDSQDRVSYWPSVSDLFMTMFIIGLAMLGALYYVLIPKLRPGEEKRVIDAVGMDMRHIREPVNRIRGALGDQALLRESQSPAEIIAGLKQTAEDVVTRLIEMQRKYSAIETELNDKSPIIRIDEATKEYRFELGSAVMRPEFIRGLQEREFRSLAQEILRRNATGKLKVDTLELIGHTDGRHFVNKGNLDDALPAYLSGQDRSVAKLHAGSNNDLGLLRALAVRDAWNDFVKQHVSRDALSKIAVRCYSAGQTIPDGGNVTDPETFRLNEKKFRRIEVRLTKLATD